MHRAHHFFHPLRLLLALCVLISATVFAVLVWRYLTARRNRPRIAKADIVYQESFASGASQKNALTQIGGARNCLRLVVTKEVLWVTSWFPFSIFTALYDLEHVIPIRNILSVQRLSSSSRDGLLLTYAEEPGSNHSLKLYPKDRDAFLRALSPALGHPITNIAT